MGALHDTLVLRAAALWQRIFELLRLRHVNDERETGNRPAETTATWVTLRRWVKSISQSLSEQWKKQEKDMEMHLVKLNNSAKSCTIMHLIPDIRVGFEGFLAYSCFIRFASCEGSVSLRSSSSSWWGTSYDFLILCLFFLFMLCLFLQICTVNKWQCIPAVKEREVEVLCIRPQPSFLYSLTSMEGTSELFTSCHHEISWEVSLIFIGFLNVFEANPSLKVTVFSEKQTADMQAWSLPMRLAATEPAPMRRWKWTEMSLNSSISIC